MRNILLSAALCCAASAQSFQTPALYGTQNGPFALATADFNSDGKLDMAVANSNSSSLSIYRGNGDGTFQTATIVPAPNGYLITNLTPGNFTASGHTDLLVVCGFQTTVWVLPGLGNGQFGTAIPMQLPQIDLAAVGPEWFFQDVAVADFNGDGKLDLVLALADADLSNAGVFVFLGRGNGTFQSPAPVSNALAFSVVAANMKNDKQTDLVLATTNGIEVLLGNGDGTFQEPATYPLSSQQTPFSMIVADVNADGIPDVVTTGISADGDGSTSDINVLLGIGGGVLAPGFIAEESDLVYAIAAVALNGTGGPDLVEVVSIGSDGTSAGLAIRANNGDGSFQNALPFSFNLSGSQFIPLFGTTPLVTADWNGDGLPDLAFLTFTGANLEAVNARQRPVPHSDTADITQAIQLYQELGAGDMVVMLNANTPPPLISVSTPQLQFAYTAGATVPPAAQSIAISNGRNGAFNWTATTNASWLTVSPASGSAPDSSTVSVATGLAATSYTGTITISAAGASNTPFTVPVTLVVSAPGTLPAITSVVNGASFQAGFEAGSWVTIKGTNLSNSLGQTWTASDFVNGNLPTQLANTGVTIDGKPAYVSYVSAFQINAQAPSDSNTGMVNVVVNNNGTPSAAFQAMLQTYSPAFFEYPLTSYAIATRYPDNALIGNPSSITGTVAAAPGDILILWATGFGATAPATAAGVVVTGAPAVAALPTITVGGTPVTVISAVLSPGSVGLYQVAIQLPSSVPTGTVAIQASVGGVQSPTAVDIFVEN